MRHAESPFSWQQQDIERILSSEGERQAKAMGTFLKRKGMLPDVIFTSVAKRTMQTAQLLSVAAGISEERIFPSESLYNARPEQIEEAIIHAGFSEEVQQILVLAHNPGISNFASICSQETKSFSFVPAAMAGFELKADLDWINFSAQDAVFSFYQAPTE